MPTIRYQIRNEYGLADAELYQTAGKDDPEVILEGVAMAGLVGMLRQLGDISEFAAGIFCDLHEDVMGMAARGHGLMLRAQQIEAELPTVEKSLLSKSHPNFAYNDGIDWHSNIQVEQNLITQGDMPIFILDSYEECHGPPRLFTLDKFDIVGAGACLKRYSDPSFFKMEQVSSTVMETNIPKEIKIQKMKKKGSQWRNGQTLESLLSTLADPNLQQTNSDKVLDKSAKHFVRLKSWNLNGANGSGDSLRKSFLALHSDEQKAVFDHCRTHLNFNAISINSSEFSSKTHGTVLDISTNHPLSRNGSHNMIPSEIVATLRTDQMDIWKENDEKLSDEQLESIYVVENQQRNFNFAERKEKFADSENKQEGSAYDYELSDPTGTTSVQVVDHYVIEDELKLDGSSTDGYRTEDIGSELENFIDVLNSMGSEVETDPENNGEPYLNMLREEAHEMDDDDSNEVLEKLQTETSELYSAEVSTRALGLDNILESGMSSILYCDTVIEPAVMLATQGSKGVSDSYGNSSLILGGTNNEKYEELLAHDGVANSADLISDGVSNLRTFKMRSDNSKESCSPNVISSSLNNLQPQESFHTHLVVSSNQNEISSGHIAQLRTDTTARCFNGSSHYDSNFPAEPIIAEHVNEMVLEDMTGTHQMLNDHSFSPTESFSMHTDKARLLNMAMPAGKEKQNSVDQDAKSFASEDIKANSSGRSSLSLTIASVPVNSMNVAQLDGLAAEMDHGQHPEELTSETSANFTKKTNDVVQNMNDSTLGTKDRNVSDSSHIASIAVVLMSEEESFIRQLVDRHSDTEHKNSLVTDLPCIDVPEYPSNAPADKLVWSVSQDFGVNSTETILPPVPSFATISGKDCMKKIENTESVGKLSMVGSVLGFDNSCTEIDGFATPNILQPHLQLIYDTEESQESMKTNLADQSHEFLNLKITVESKESSKLYIAEDSQKSCKVITAERMSSSCSRSETCTTKVIKSPMHVLDSLKFSTETNQDNLEKNVEVVDQIIHVKNLSTEYSSPCDEIYNHDPSLVYCQEAYDLQSVVNSTEILLPPAPSVVAAGDKDCLLEIENIDEVESLFSLESADDFENVQMTKADQETSKILQPTSEYFSDTQEYQESFKVNSEEKSQESPWLNSTKESYEFPNLNISEESQESSEVQASEWVTSPRSGSGTCFGRVTSSAMLVLDYLKFSTDINQNPQKNIENAKQIICVKNLSPENSASGSETYNHDPSLGYNQEANGLQSKLQEESTDFSAAPCEVVVFTHERDCSYNLEVLDARSYMDMSVSSELDKSPLVSDASCSGLLGETNDDIPVVHVEAYSHTSVTETAKQELSLSTNMFVDTARSPIDASTLDSIIPETSHQKAGDLELGIPTNSDNIDKLSEGPELNYHDIANNIKYNEVDMLQSDEKQGMEINVLPKRSSEISSFHLTSNALAVTVSHVPKSDVPFTESATRPSSESLLDEPASNFASRNPEESPPLPPLPPLEWMTRKIQLSSLLPSEDSSVFLAGTNPFTEPLYDKPAKPSVPAPSTSYELLPTIVDQSHQHDPVLLERRTVNSSSAPLLLSSSLEYEKRGSKSPVVDSSTAVVLENQITEDSTSQENVRSMLDKSCRFSQPDPGLELEESHYSEQTQQKIEIEFVQPQNPYFIGSSLEDVNNQSTYRDFGGQNVHLLKSTELSISSRSMPHQPGFVFSLNRSQTNLLGVVPPTEDEWFSIRPRSIRNLPRNPLMEAVAAHDRSTLRKVSELARTSSETKADKNDTMLELNMLQLRKVSEILRPSIEPKAVEKDAWIEQIRSKSFSLKPAILVKPYIKGHPTNIKVAAILEKANALRQAVAGSDEEDGGDSWSDC